MFRIMKMKFYEIKYGGPCPGCGRSNDECNCDYDRWLT